MGYDGMFPGPTFKIQRGRESLVRFVNEYNRPSSVHLYGSPTRAQLDCWGNNSPVNKDMLAILDAFGDES